MAKYRLNTTKYVLKWAKKHQEVQKFNKITLSTLSDPRSAFRLRPQTGSNKQFSKNKIFTIPDLVHRPTAAAVPGGNGC